MKRTGALCPDGLNLTKQELELVDRPAEPECDRLGGVAVGLGAFQGALGVEPGEHGHGLAEARDRQRGRQSPSEVVYPRFEALQAGAEFVLQGVWGHVLEALGLSLERAHLALHELRSFLERVSLFERLADANDFLHCEDVVVMVAVGRGFHETLLRPIDELTWSDVANARGLGGRETQTCEHLAVVCDQHLGKRVVRLGLRHRTLLPCVEFRWRVLLAHKSCVNEVNRYRDLAVSGNVERASAAPPDTPP